jgi:predicted SnoaL-like aldol condensation-catalyzing enzyme
LRDSASRTSRIRFPTGTGKPTAFFDLFRVDNGKIAEHWDVIAEIPTKMTHGNGKF